MAATIDEPAPILERIASLLLNGLFGLGLIARDQSGKASSLRQGAGSFGSLSFIIASLIEAGQMLAFPFSASQHIWDGTVVRNFVVPMLTVVMPASADVWFGPMVYRVSAPHLVDAHGRFGPSGQRSCGSSRGGGAFGSTQSAAVTVAHLRMPEPPQGLWHASNLGESACQRPNRRTGRAGCVAQEKFRAAQQAE